MTWRPAVRESLRSPLVREGFDVRLNASLQDFFDTITLHVSGCVLIDVDMGMDGFRLLGEMKERHLTLPVIFVTAHADCPLAIQAMRAGAIDLLEKPFDDEALLAAIGRALTPGDLDYAEHSERKKYAPASQP